MVFSVAVPSTGNLEEAARNIRRDTFHALMAQGVVDRIALAHTRSDQAETVLFRLLRGSYTTGLGGMRPVTGEGLIRPMLEVTRAEIEAWLCERNLTWRQDSTNLDSAFARNRIRHKLLPQLETEWNPNLTGILANHAVLAQEDEDYWSAVVAASRSWAVDWDGNSLILNMLDLGSLPRALARRLIREAIRQLKGDLRQIDFRHIEQVMQLTASSEGHGRVQIPGVDVMRSFDWLRFAKLAPGPAERDWSLEAAVPGAYTIPGSSEIVLELMDSAGTASGRDTLWEEGFDWQSIQPHLGCGLEIRNWQPGDRYRRRGHAHEDKLKTLFHEFRIPLWERRNWPMVCLDRKVIWSKRFGAATEFAPTGETRAVLRIFVRGKGS